MNQEGPSSHSTDSEDMDYNPITSFWRSLMRTQMENFDEKLEDRVAE